MQTGVGQSAVAHGLDPKLGYDSMKDFVHLAQVHSGPNVLVPATEADPREDPRIPGSPTKPDAGV